MDVEGQVDMPQQGNPSLEVYRQHSVDPELLQKMEKESCCTLEYNARSSLKGGGGLRWPGSLGAGRSVRCLVGQVAAWAEGAVTAE